MRVVIEHRPERLPLAIACRALGLQRSSIYARIGQRRRGAHVPDRCCKHAPQPRALSRDERGYSGDSIFNLYPISLSLPCDRRSRVEPTAHGVGSGRVRDLEPTCTGLRSVE